MSFAMDFRSSPSAVGELLLRCLSLDIVQLHVLPPAFSAEPSERPIARPLARHQARQSKKVTSLRHEKTAADSPKLWQSW